MYRLLKIDKEFYLIDETTDINENDWCLCLDIESKYYNAIKILNNDTTLEIKEQWYKIIASTKELSNISLLSMSNCMFVSLLFYIDKKAEEYCLAIKDDKMANAFICGFSTCIADIIKENVDIINLYKSLNCDAYVKIKKELSDNKFTYIEK